MASKAPAVSSPKVRKRYPPVILATCVVPWDERHEFLEDLFRAQVRTLRRGLTRHLYIFGTAGEGYAVSDRQFERIARVFRAETRGRTLHGMVGVINLSLSTIIDRIGLGRDLGFREFQISLPSWGALADVEVDRFFQETCGRFPDCRFLHYNLVRAKRILAGADYARLAARHPNLVAVKTGSQDAKLLRNLLTRAPEMQFFVGELAYARLRERYECGLLISMASTNHGTARKFFAARGKALQALAREMQAASDALTEVVGDAAHMDGAYDKLLYKLCDTRFPLRLLPPYQSTTDAMAEAYRSRLPARWLPE